LPAPAAAIVQNIGQSRAIANYIAKKAGPVLEGKSDKDFALSQVRWATLSALL
jgi:hypothetical protein